MKDLKKLKKLVSDHVAEHLRKSTVESVHSHESGGQMKARINEAVKDLRLDEDGVLEGMKFEIVEETDDVKLIREVMEEPSETVRGIVTFRLPAQTGLIHLGLHLPEESLLSGTTPGVVDATPDPAAFETETGGLAGDEDNRGQEMALHAVGPGAEEADPSP